VRTIAIGEDDGPRFGKLQYSQTAPLRDKEVILTFDDGPLSPHTNVVLDALDRHCVKATFFAVGRMALFNPAGIRAVARRGHTIATHTWSHPRDIRRLSFEEGKLEIEKGFAAISYALGAPIAPFFRFPGLNESPELAAYLATRNISVWSVDVVSGDTTADITREKLIDDTMARIRRAGRGIILFHDIKKVTADAIEEIIVRLKMEGFKIVHVVSNTSYIPDRELLAKVDFKLSVRTVAFTGQPIDGAGKVDTSILAGPVDYARSERVVLDVGPTLTNAAKRRARAETPSERIIIMDPEIKDKKDGLSVVLGQDLLLSTGEDQPARPR
jgi:peptidoglycan/xylan/chitin deacetylase (PgdA/CDA1 family)